MDLPHSGALSSNNISTTNISTSNLTEEDYEKARRFVHYHYALQTLWLYWLYPSSLDSAIFRIVECWHQTHHIPANSCLWYTRITQYHIYDLLIVLAFCCLVVVDDIGSHQNHSKIQRQTWIGFGIISTTVSTITTRISSYTVEGRWWRIRKPKNMWGWREEKNGIFLWRSRWAIRFARLRLWSRVDA